MLNDFPDLPWIEAIGHDRQDARGDIIRVSLTGAHRACADFLQKDLRITTASRPLERLPSLQKHSPQKHW